MSYFQAGGIDRPLVIWKSGVGSVVTHQNWRGQFARGTWGAGHSLVGQSSDCTAAYTGQNCVPMPWPGWNTGAWFQEAAKPQTVGSERYWLGSLSVEMRDASGLMYKRNRYYNPQTAHFTQPDPIGLAGGLNIYGFAAGDPVTYTDPYGLSAEGCCDWLKERWAAWNARLDRQEQRAIEDLSRFTGGDREAARRLYNFGTGAGMMSTGTIRSGGQVLHRLGESRESAARLARRAAEAEEAIGIHGVSVTAGTPRGPASSAAREVVEREFPVHNTPTRGDPLHRTVELPKPVTANVAELFNRLFGRK